MHGVDHVSLDLLRTGGGGGFEGGSVVLEHLKLESLTLLIICSKLLRESLKISLSLVSRGADLRKNVYDSIISSSLESRSSRVVLVSQVSNGGIISAELAFSVVRELGQE